MSPRELLPPLPEAATSALEALRRERPSPRFELRLGAALRETDEAPRPAAPATRARASETPLLVGTVMAALLVLITLQTDPHHLTHEAFSAQELPAHWMPLKLPAQGAGWLELPWKPSLHSGEPAMVRVDTPAELNFHQNAWELPALRLVSCEAGRCVHQFRVSRGTSALPLRVRIDKPGRYEFRVSHASYTREVNEHFVVVADH